MGLQEGQKEGLAICSNDDHETLKGKIKKRSPGENGSRSCRWRYRMCRSRFAGFEVRRDLLRQALETFLELVQRLLTVQSAGALPSAHSSIR